MNGNDNFCVPMAPSSRTHSRKISADYLVESQPGVPFHPTDVRYRGVKRTYPGHRGMPAFDPKQALGLAERSNMTNSVRSFTGFADAGLLPHGFWRSPLSVIVYAVPKFI